MPPNIEDADSLRLVGVAASTWLMDNLSDVLNQKADVVPDAEHFEIAYVWKLC
jgi:hypothetical protein